MFNRRKRNEINIQVVSAGINENSVDFDAAESCEKEKVQIISAKGRVDIKSKADSHGNQLLYVKSDDNFVIHFAESDEAIIDKPGIIFYQNGEGELCVDGGETIRIKYGKGISKSKVVLIDKETSKRSDVEEFNL